MRIFSAWLVLAILTGCASTPNRFPSSIRTDYGLSSPEDRAWSEEERRFYENDYMKAIVDWIGDPKAKDRILRFVAALSSPDAKACDCDAVGLAIEIHRAGRGQMRINHEEAQRGAAKAILESFFRLSLAQGLDQEARQRVRAHLRDLFLPPSYLEVQAAKLEIERRDKQEATNSGTKKMQVTPELRLKAIKKFIRSARTALKGRRQSDLASFWELTKASFDGLEKDLGSGVLWGYAGEVVAAVSSELVPDPTVPFGCADPLSAILNARVASSYALEEARSYERLFGN